MIRRSLSNGNPHIRKDRLYIGLGLQAAPVHQQPRYWLRMMTSSNGDIIRVTGPLCEEFTGHRWIPLTEASDADLWYILWSAPE